MESTGTIPKIHLQPPSVDFIDIQLPDYHEAFRNPLARSASALDPAPASLLRLQGRPSDAFNGDSTSDDDDSDDGAGDSLSPVPRPLPPQVAEMEFWDSIFNDALESFKRENEKPKARPEVYDIRSTINWDAVFERLQHAREAYNGTNKEGFGAGPTRHGMG
ncbi:hypothetical protein B0T25DRAFT_579016 [Lasiosphaeria hispida]|uniref:Uncharacterized protein n=1 Tax=Lasiosphaeria hispida TaxID=260671 RepID=A0AAJ0HL22_9PEZI|nr:hypothetical protein B0T25DRAFT_579016 [Lasiosphaeria hispida]